MSLKWKALCPNKDPNRKKRLGSFWDLSGGGPQLRTRSQSRGLAAAMRNGEEI